MWRKIRDSGLESQAGWSCSGPPWQHYQSEPIGSRSEKTVARTAFDAALRRELQEVMQEAKEMANQIHEPADLWDLEHYLT